MQKNIVILCDGTCNDLAGDLTNIAYLKSLAGDNRLSNQLVRYEPGVGSSGTPGLATRIGRKVSQYIDAAVATTLVSKVRGAYQQLATDYHEGDRVFVFGFSRGAYTARVLAGLIHHYGLLKPEHAHRAEEVVVAYRNLMDEDDDSEPGEGGSGSARTVRFEEAAKIRRTSSREVKIGFLGLFDTVSSVGHVWDPQKFPSTARMPSVKVIRHALAIDERRAKFRPNRVTPVDGQDVQELWFAGVHSDVGGGYPKARNALARVPLSWMLGEARSAGLQVDADYESTLGLLESAAQDEQAAQNESLKPPLWPLAELLWLPYWRQDESNKWQRGRRMYLFRGWRRLRENDRAHPSLMRRKSPVRNPHWRKT